MKQYHNCWNDAAFVEDIKEENDSCYKSDHKGAISTLKRSFCFLFVWHKAHMNIQNRLEEEKTEKMSMFSEVSVLVQTLDLI